VIAALIVMLVIVLGLFALIWWGASGPPTRPRPGSRHRGSTFLDVDRKLRRARRR
jgi:hypothetical protein